MGIFKDLVATRVLDSGKARVKTTRRKLSRAVK